MKVLLLDRDGTVIAEPTDYRVDRKSKIKLFDDSIEALKLLADNGFGVILITNQAGIEEGRIDEEEFWDIHSEVLSRLSPSGVKILKTYMNGEKDKPNASQWRKPGPNMLLQAAKEFKLDLAKVYMVGDQEVDIQAAINAGCKGGVLVQTTNEDYRSPEAVYNAPTLLDAVKYIISSYYR